MDSLERLKEPFADVKTRKGPGGRELSYITARQVMDRLDEVFGIMGWQRRHIDVGGTMVCEIGVKTEDGWIFKADGADESDIEGTKGALSDSFKRAAVSWGVGRYLYGDEAPAKTPEKKFPAQSASGDFPTDAQLKYLDSLLKEEEKVNPGAGDKCWERLGKEPKKDAVGKAITHYVELKEKRDA